MMVELGAAPLGPGPGFVGRMNMISMYSYNLVILLSVIYSLLPRLMTAAASTRLSPRLVVVAGAPLSTNISFTLQSHIIQYRKVFVDIN